MHEGWTPIYNWLRHIQDVRDRHRNALELLPEHGPADALCELNVSLALFNIGFNMVSMQQVDKGLELMERAISKGMAKRPSDARLRMAVANPQGGAAQR